jgi:hypothetical protein
VSTISAGAADAHASAGTSSAPASPTPPSAATLSSSTAAEPPPLPTERSAEPFTLAGRPIPIAAVLFWGGMVVGMILKAFAGEDGETPFRYVPYSMVLGGILWFSVTELNLLLRNRQRRR